MYQKRMVASTFAVLFRISVTPPAIIVGPVNGDSYIAVISKQPALSGAMDIREDLIAARLGAFNSGYGLSSVLAGMRPHCEPD